MKKNNTIMQSVTKPNQRSAKKSVDESPEKKVQNEAGKRERPQNRAHELPANDSLSALKPSI
jgi:hypothetical protein